MIKIDGQMRLSLMRWCTSLHAGAQQFLNKNILQESVVEKHSVCGEMIFTNWLTFDRVTAMSLISASFGHNRPIHSQVKAGTRTWG